MVQKGVVRVGKDLGCGNLDRSGSLGKVHIWGESWDTTWRGM